MHTLKVRISTSDGPGGGGTPLMEGLLPEGNAMSALMNMISLSRPGQYRTTKFTVLHPRVVRVFHSMYIDLGLENKKGNHPRNKTIDCNYSFYPAPKEDHVAVLRPFLLLSASLVHTYPDTSTPEVLQQAVELIRDGSIRSIF
jgi:hypothetical protein